MMRPAAFAFRHVIGAQVVVAQVVAAQVVAVQIVVVKAVAAIFARLGPNHT